MLEGYKIGVAHVKEKMLLDLLNGSLREQNTDNGKLAILDERFQNKSFLFFLVDYKRKFFDAAYDKFADVIEQSGIGEFDCMNLNEFQSGILVRYDSSTVAPRPEEIARTLLELLWERFQEQVIIVHSGLIADIAHIAAAYSQMYCRSV